MSRGSRARDLDYNRDDRRSRPSDNDLAARIFIGGLNTKNLSHRELVDWMNRYGKVLDVAIFDRHVLVQFDRESEGRRAIDREKGQSYRGSRFDIRFASSSDGSIGSRPEVSRSRSPRSTMPYDRDPRDISPPYRDAIRDRSPIDRERERYFKERHTSPDYRRYERPRSNMEDGRVPANPANIRPDFQEPNWNVQPFTNQLTTERPGFDAAIIVMSSELLTYAETIEARLQRQIALTTHIIVLKEESHANACVEDLTNKGVLYAFLVNGMNEKHFSCSLRILYGNPQEHRNMPLNSALTFVAQNFESYQKRVRELKSIAPKPTFDPSRMPPGFIAPDDKIIYLLHLLADSRMLTIEELNDVIDFVQKRIKALAQAEGLIDKTNQSNSLTITTMPTLSESIQITIFPRQFYNFVKTIAESRLPVTSTIYPDQTYIPNRLKHNAKRRKLSIHVFNEHVKVPLPSLIGFILSEEILVHVAAGHIIVVCQSGDETKSVFVKTDNSIRISRLLSSKRHVYIESTVFPSYVAVEQFLPEHKEENLGPSLNLSVNITLASYVPNQSFLRIILSPKEIQSKIKFVEVAFAAASNNWSVPLQIAITNYDGHVLYNSLVCPRMQISNWHTESHGLTEESVLGQQDWEIVRIKCRKILNNSILVGYNIIRWLRSLDVYWARLYGVRDVSKALALPVALRPAQKPLPLNRLVSVILKEDISKQSMTTMDTLMFIRKLYLALESKWIDDVTVKSAAANNNISHNSAAIIQSVPRKLTSDLTQNKIRNDCFATRGDNVESITFEDLDEPNVEILDDDDESHRKNRV